MLITFEGGEACGKTVQIKLLSKYLQDKGFDFIVSREPGGTDVGEKIRNILLHSDYDMSPTVEFLLFSASRAEHIDKVVSPALKAGKLVILDRYYDSSYTYQGFAGDLKLEDLQAVTDFAIRGAVPDLTILLDISYEEAMKRKAKDENLKNLDRIEQKGRDYHNKVRYGYLQLAKMYPERFFVVDASKSIEEVFNTITTEIERRLPRKTFNKAKE